MRDRKYVTRLLALIVSTCAPFDPRSASSIIKLSSSVWDFWILGRYHSRTFFAEGIDPALGTLLSRGVGSGGAGGAIAPPIKFGQGANIGANFFCKFLKNFNLILHGFYGFP